MPNGLAVARRPQAAALVSPFDPLLWERDRAEQLLDFHYRIELYTPARKREYGYYVLPFLIGDRIAARLDLKADRQRSQLLVQAAHLEPRAPLEATANAAADEMVELARWLGLADVKVCGRGTLSAGLADALRAVTEKGRPLGSNGFRSLPTT